MRQKIAITLLLFFLFLGCSKSFYQEKETSRKIVSLNKVKSSNHLILKDYIICNIYQRNAKDNLEKLYEDSIISIFESSLNNSNLFIDRLLGSNKGYNLYCSYEKPIKIKHISVSEILNYANINDPNKTVILPIIIIGETVSSTSLHPGGLTYKHQVWLKIIIYLVKNNEIIYTKHVTCGPIDSPENVMSEWLVFDTEPMNHLTQDHWDTLVGLGMKEYIEQLNRIE